jgi:hypothetical protein
MKKRLDTTEAIANYIAFLEKRLASKNYLAQASPEEIQKTKDKLKSEKTKLKLLKK